MDNEHDNARVLDFSDSYIARLRTATISAAISVSGTNGYYTLSTNPTGGSSGSYRYEWAISTSGPGNYTVVSTERTYTAQFPLGTSYIRLTVRRGPGEAITVYRTVTYTEQSICERKPWLPECGGVFLTAGDLDVTDAAKAEGEELVTALAITPNPASVSVHVIYSVAEEGSVRVAVYDIRGREVAVVAEGEVRAGEHSAMLQSADLAPGVYVLRMTTGTGVFTRLLTIVR